MDLIALEATPAPTVSGSGRALDDLTAITGTWLPEPVALTYQSYLDGTAIPGATAATYRTVATQVGKQVTVHVTGRKAGYLTVTRQSPGITVTQRAFAQAPDPVIQGSGFAGDQLTAVAGTWDPVISPSYQWFADGVAISGAMGSAYRPTEAQAGQQIHVVTTGTSPGYATTLRHSAPITVNLRQLVGAKPDILGEPYVGLPVTADAGVWQPAGTNIRYRWLANGEPIASATGRSLTLTEKQRGTKLSVEITASLANHETVVVRSDPVDVEIRHFMTQAPRISGTLKVGSAVYAQPGSWLPAPSSTAYEWYVGSALVGRGSYVNVPPSAAGKRLRLVMTGNALYFATGTATATSGVVAYGTLSSSAPSVHGLPKPNKVLRVNPGYWRPGPVTYRYQWYVGSKAIAGATKPAYESRRSTRVRRFASVSSERKKSGYKSVTRYSRYTKIATK